jgi:hypothetical protein
MPLSHGRSLAVREFQNIRRNGEKEGTFRLSHFSGKKLYLLTPTTSLTPIPGTVLPTTAAICRTWAINSSN